VQPEIVQTSSERLTTATNKILEGKKILVVEDSLDNQLLAELYLSRSGAQVEFANNGLDGLQKIKSHDYDVVLMDIQMPVMDGYTATQEVRRAGIQLPIIALTGFAMKEDQQKCLEAGCNDYLAKPFDRHSLIKCITKVLPDSSLPHLST
jgi:CheY-like chemotaxis protein